MSQIYKSISSGPLPPEIATTYTASDSTTATPANNNLNVFGTGSITSTASGSTVTYELTGLTNHAVLVGAGTTTITKVGPTATAGQVLQSSGSSADPAFSTATYPSTTTINQILYSSSANVVTGLATLDNGVLITSSSGVPELLANSGTAGYVLTANSGAPPSWQEPPASGSWILIQTQNASSSASLTFSIGSSYNNYYLIWDNVIAQSGGGQAFELLYNQGSGIVTSGYSSAGLYAQSSGSPTVVSDITTYAILGNAVSSSNPSSGSCLIGNSQYKNSIDSSYNTNTCNDNGTYGIGMYGGRLGNSAAITAFEVKMASGNILEGTVSLYGIVS